MEYVIVALIVLALVGGAVTFFVINATKKGGPAAPDPSPAGDTTEHSGDQREGQTVTDTESAGGDSDGEGDGPPRVGDPGPEAQPPDSERLANRPR